VREARRCGTWRFVMIASDHRRCAYGTASWVLAWMIGLTVAPCRYACSRPHVSPWRRHPPLPPHAIAPDLAPEPDGKSVPGVDGSDRQRQVDQLLLVEVLPHALVELVGNVVLRDERQGFRPLESRPLALAVERSLAPRRQQVEALLGLPCCARVLGVHVDAVRAAVELRGACLDQFEERVLETAAPHVRLQLAERRDSFVAQRAVLDAWLHGSQPYPLARALNSPPSSPARRSSSPPPASAPSRRTRRATWRRRRGSRDPGRPGSRTWCRTWP